MNRTLRNELLLKASIKDHVEKLEKAGWTVGARVKFNAAALSFFNDPKHIRKYSYEAEKHPWPVVKSDMVGTIVKNYDDDSTGIRVDFAGDERSWSKEWLELA